MSVIPKMTKVNI